MNAFTAEVYRADLGIKGDRYAAVERCEDVRPTFALPLAGLMTPEPVQVVGPRVEAYNIQAVRLGILASTRSPILSLAGLALVVIPDVKSSDLGLVHVTSQQLLPLFPAA